jgi:very-short-patch-repair endonuclease
VTASTTAETTPAPADAAARIVRAARSLDGVVRVRTLIHHGHSRHQINRAVEKMALVRVRKGWVAVPDADPYLVSAARAGVVLSCVTQARRLGLWVLAEPGTHVAAPGHGNAAAGNAIVHWSKPVVPRHPDSLVDPIENVLVLVAQCQPFEAAIAVWESALNKKLVDRSAMSRLALPARARRVFEAAVPYSDSGLESFVVPRLNWLRISIIPQVWIAEHRVDFLIGDRLVLQIDGATHVGAQRQLDIAHDAQLMLLGYHVIRVGYWQVVDRWHTVQDLVTRAVAQGLHLAQD